MKQYHPSIERDKIVALTRLIDSRLGTDSSRIAITLSRTEATDIMEALVKLSNKEFTK